MSTQQTITGGGNGKERGLYDYTGGAVAEVQSGIGLSTLRGTINVTEGEITRFNRRTMETGEPIFSAGAGIDTIKAIIMRSQEILEDVIDTFDIDQIESINKFTMFGEQIRLIWANREYVNEPFKEVLVHLLAAIRSSQYHPFDKLQYEAIRSVLERIENLNISKVQVRDSLLILIDGNIDISAPIRNWEDYTVEVRKRDK